MFEGVDFATGMQLTMTSPDGTKQVFREPALQAIQSTSFQVSVSLTDTGVYGFQIESASGADSEIFTIVVQPASGTLPTVATVSPTNVTRSQQATSVTIIGSNFNPAAEVLVTPPSGATQSLSGALVALQSSTRIDVNVVFDAQGIYSLAVRNPTGEMSNSVNVTVN